MVVIEIIHLIQITWVIHIGVIYIFILALWLKKARGKGDVFNVLNVKVGMTN